MGDIVCPHCHELIRLDQAQEFACPACGKALTAADAEDAIAAGPAPAKAGVPLVPGYHGDEQKPAYLGSEAGKIGYPILIKFTWIGVKIERLSFSVGRDHESVKIELMFLATEERAELVVNQLRKLVAISRAELRPALMARL